MTASVYRLHGLRVGSEVPLGEPGLPCVEPPDVLLVLGAPAVSAREPSADLQGAVVAELAEPQGLIYRVFRRSSGTHILRAYRTGDFEVSAKFNVVTCRPCTGVDPQWLPIVLRGTVMALLLDLRRRPTLHASAVEVDGGAVAFAGMSGAGKTTMAVLMCAAGCRLVTDDVLAVEVDMDSCGAWCLPGSSELRLRDVAANLADLSGWARERRLMIDGRVAVRPPAAGDDPLPLRAVLFPRVARWSDRVTLSRVRPVEAVFRLAGVPRFRGWTCPDALCRAFALATRLAEEVPIFDVSVPWGPPWDHGVALEAIDLLMGARV